MNHIETNEDWEEKIKIKLLDMTDVIGDKINDLLDYRGIDDCGKSMRGGCKEIVMPFIIREMQTLIRSLRQSDKELILGKMEEIEGLQTLITVDGTQIISNDSDRSPYIKKSEALDTCKSIVEETLK